MGKRELLLIVVFVAAGAVIWQLTAPPRDPNQPGFSLSRLIGNLRNELGGTRVEVSLDKQASIVASPGAARLLVPGYRGALTVIGEDREDVAVALKATVFGSEPAETKAAADQIRLTLKEDGKDIVLVVERPEMRRRPTFQLDVRLPRRLTAQIEVQGERVEVRNLAAVEGNLRFASTAIRDVSGEVKVEQRDGRLEVSGAGSVALLTRRTEVRVDRVAGRARIEATDDRVTVRRVTGPMSVESRRVEVEVEDLAGDLVATVTDGAFLARGVAGAVNVESQRCRVGLTLDGKAPVTVNASGAPVDLTLPDTARVTLDLDLLDGEIRLPEHAGLEVASRDGHQNVKGPLRGGGPIVKLRARQGGITIR